MLYIVEYRFEQELDKESASRTSLSVILYENHGLASCHVNWSLTNSFFDQTGHLLKSLSSFYTMKILYTFLNDVSYYKVVF